MLFTALAEKKSDSIPRDLSTDLDYITPKNQDFVWADRICQLRTRLKLFRSREKRLPKAGLSTLHTISGKRAMTRRFTVQGRNKHGTTFAETV